ncbi:MAG: DUF2065 domain-containing protein [Pseudomonadota bacterium]
MDLNYFFSVVGLVLVIEGFPYFAFPEKLKRFLAQIPALPDLHLRVYGLMAMIIGLVLLYIARSQITF